MYFAVILIRYLEPILSEKDGQVIFKTCLYIHPRPQLTQHLLYVIFFENVWTDCIKIGKKYSSTGRNFFPID